MYKTIKELLSSPDRWCKGALAKNVDGVPVLYMSVDACRWCAFGAMCLIAGRTATDATKKLRQAAMRLGIGLNLQKEKAVNEFDVVIGITNDNINHSTLMRWLEEAGV